MIVKPAYQEIGAYTNNSTRHGYVGGVWLTSSTEAPLAVGLTLPLSLWVAPVVRFFVGLPEGSAVCLRLRAIFGI